MTIAVILLTAQMMDTTASLLGQGDNQVVLLKVPSGSFLEAEGSNRQEYIDRFVTMLADNSAKAGLVVKTQETWTSTTLFEYARRYHYKGSQVPSGLKRVVRIASEANQTLPSVSADISSIFSTGTSAAQEDISPIPSFYVAAVETLFLLHHHRGLSRPKGIDQELALLTTTNTLGGYPVSPITSFMYRAIQDPLTESLAFVRSLIAQRPETLSHIPFQLRHPRDLTNLIKDPMSIPVLQPQQAD